MHPKIYFNAWNKKSKSPFGAAKENEFVRIVFRIQEDYPVRQIVLRLRRDKEVEDSVYPLMERGSSENFTTYEVVFFVKTRGLYFYRFEIQTDSGTLFVGRDEEAGAVIGDFLPEWQLTVYAEDFSVPDGLDTGIMYQIFPDRFRRGSHLPLPGTPGPRTVHKDWNERPLFAMDVPEYVADDFFCGDLPGITEKLDYLAGLGVTILYLNPIFEAAANHRYNTGDYRAIDPYLGTVEDFEELCLQADKRGIRVILDGVFSHTGSDSRYFNREGHYPDQGAWQSTESPYASWYRFFNPERTEYECWWGFTTLPNVNEENPVFQDFICGGDGVLQEWMGRGATGWRLDVADELPDSFLDAVRKRVKAVNPQALLIGEVWEDASVKESYGQRRRYLLGDQLDSVMNYPWREAILEFVEKGDALLFYRRVMSLLDHYPQPAVKALMNLLSTHDTIRTRTLLGVRQDVDAFQEAEYQPTPEEMERGARGLQLASLLQYTLPGYPSLYYGDEAGMNGFSDPWNRRCYPWGMEDQKLLDFFRAVGQLRRGYPADMQAELCFAAKESGLAAYWRGELLTAVSAREEHAFAPNRPVKPLLLVGEVALKEDGTILFGKKSGGIFITEAGFRKGAEQGAL